MERVSVVGNQKKIGSKKKSSTRNLVAVSFLSTIAFLLMFIEMPIPGLFPEFLKIDISDIPALIAGLTMGPIAGVAVEVLKNLLHAMKGSMTGGVGELANIIVGSAFVVATTLVYRKKSDLKGLILGFVAGTISIVVVGSLVNYFILIPFYGKLMGLEAIIGLGAAINPQVKDVLGFVLWFIAPFNLIKGILISILSIPLYKKIEQVIKNR